MTDLPDEETMPARRSRPVEDPTAEGSTLVARRESRRRESRRVGAAHKVADAPVAGAPVTASDPALAASRTAGRVASAPPVADAYDARPPDPVIAVRSAPPARVAQAPVDGAAGAASHRRRARRTALSVIVAASGVAVLAAASVLVVAFTP